MKQTEQAKCTGRWNPYVVYVRLDSHDVQKCSCSEALLYKHKSFTLLHSHIGSTHTLYVSLNEWNTLNKPLPKCKKKGITEALPVIGLWRGSQTESSNMLQLEKEWFHYISHKRTALSWYRLFRQLERNKNIFTSFQVLHEATKLTAIYRVWPLEGNCNLTAKLVYGIWRSTALMD